MKKGEKLNWKSGLFVFLVLLSPISSSAVEKDIFSYTLEELLAVKITGSTLTPKSLETVPSATTVFTHEEINAMGFDTLDELTNLVPGFQSYRSSLTPLDKHYSSRGRRISSGSTEVLVLVDGQRLHQPLTASSTFVVPRFPLSNIQRVEFLRGPGAAIYGSNALTGVINIITRKNINELTLSTGSFGRIKATALGSHQLKSAKVDWFLQIDDDNGERYNVQDTFAPGRINTDDPRKLTNFNVSFQWSKLWLNFRSDQFKTENFYEVNLISNGINSRDGVLNAASLKYELNWNDVESTVWLSMTEGKNGITAQLSPPGALSPISNPSSNDPLLISADFKKSTELRFQWLADWSIDKVSNFQFGIEYRHIDSPESFTKNNFDIRDLVNFNFPIRYYGSLEPTTSIQAESQRDIFGIYGQYQHDLSDDTHLTIGLRRDDFSNIGSQLSPRLGLVQNLNSNNTLKLLYSEAFRAPAESELFLQNNPVSIGNPNLKPETAKSWEAIWYANWNQSSFSMVYFESRYDNAIQQINIGGGNLQYLNIKHGPIKGLELEYSNQLSQDWMLKSTFFKLTDKPDSAFREADRTGSLSLSYQQENWQLHFIANYHDSRQSATVGSDDIRIDLDDYWVGYAKASYRFDSGWNAYLQAKNLFNAEYMSPALTNTLTEGIPNRGRELLLGIQNQF